MYPHSKIDKVQKAIEKRIKRASNIDEQSTESNLPESSLDAAEIIDQLKEKFAETTNYSGKVQLLTALPKSWTKVKIQREFRTTKIMAAKAKIIQNEKTKYMSIIYIDH